MQIRRFINRLGFGAVAVAGVAVLASCGGGGSSDNGMAPPVAVVSNTPPASASASPDGFIAFLKILTPMQPVDTLPLDVTGFVAPTSDNTPFDPSI